MSANPFVAVRIFNKMRTKGHSLRVEGGTLVVESAVDLSDEQAEFIRTHKAALVALLADAETLADALDTAGTAGLSWREGIPDDWDDDRAIAANEVLYRTHRQIFRLGRHYATAFAPPRPDYSQATKAPEIAPVSEVAA